MSAADREKDAISWNRLVARHGVTIWRSVPAILEMLLACRTAESQGSLRPVGQGGDYIKPETVQTLRDLSPDLALYSLGGPTRPSSIW
ncbi:AMP-binding protein [Pluralibacter gergoviae]|uniref:AMP-binding protein n=1 Tax=Pluralibacter gergoviae TaxID=61647 RepID=UPI0029069D68|nr:AMP-binding protein [Pluralibacter gergoviae]MDU4002418.1 AMP-binding protein [Pluralibacter gergoviae]